ncbi:sodium:solute symporter family protein [Nitrosococcus wardiae]|uniref:Sodium transporter n=1 Tax=Nitrosococcus wardiae TaxID=1814290 RepID=A0A4P7BX99_9GAMM|nr:sodium:solute symporter family protein [Nitrosococcus wardiae]QBQ53927.1 sodium transporter [Nitrosococcus wardiae]
MIDLLIVLAFVVYAISAGLYSRRAASQNLQEYFLAGKTISGWRAGFSMAATQSAADTPLLVTGLIATAGIFALWRLWIYGFAFLLMAFVFAIGWRRSGVLTDAEFTETRYSGRGVLLLRGLKAIYYGTVINCVVLAMVMVATVRITEVFLPWHEWLPSGFYESVVSSIAGTGLRLGESVTGLAPEIATTNNAISILLILLFTAMYSTTGGLRAVVATDVVQFILAMIGTFIYAWVIIKEVGGLEGLATQVIHLYGAEEASRMLSFFPEATSALLLPFLTLIGLQWLFQMNADGTGYLAQRSMACRTDRDARVAGVVFAWMQIFLRSLLWLAIAVGLLVLYPFSPQEISGGDFATSREILFATGINELLPPGIRGLMMVGLLAALASTVDTHLNWGASYWSNDIYDRLISQHWFKREPKSHELVIVARLANILILVIALAIMANLGSIQAAWFISLLFGAGMGSVLILRWLWERINLYSELAAIAASLITAPLLLLFLGMEPETEWLRLSIMALVTTSAAIGITYVTPRTDDQVLVSFYERVQPFGFWSNTAQKAGDRSNAPLEAFQRRLKAAILTALSLFFLLVSVGKLILSIPGESAFWPWVLLLAGIALIPLWWRELRQEDLEIDRSLQPQDVQVTDHILLEEKGGLLAALQQLAHHMKLVYGMEVEVGVRGAHCMKEPGQRLLMFQNVEDLLLYMARYFKLAKVRVILGQQDGYHLIELIPKKSINLEASLDRVPDKAQPFAYNILEHIEERLYQIEGRLKVKPSRRHAKRIILTSAIELQENPPKMPLK